MHACKMISNLHMVSELRQHLRLRRRRVSVQTLRVWRAEDVIGGVRREHRNLRYPKPRTVKPKYRCSCRRRRRICHVPVFRLQALLLLLLLTRSFVQRRRRRREFGFQLGSFVVVAAAIDTVIIIIIIFVVVVFVFLGGPRQARQLLDQGHEVTGLRVDHLWGVGVDDDRLLTLLVASIGDGGLLDLMGVFVDLQWGWARPVDFAHRWAHDERERDGSQREGLIMDEDDGGGRLGYLVPLVYIYLFFREQVKFIQRQEPVVYAINYTSTLNLLLNTISINNCLTL